MGSLVSLRREAATSELSWFRQYLAFFEAIGILGVLVGYSLAASLKLNGGVFTYGRDDAYIHMAMAKNLVLHHVWGVTRFEFVSASSSPLWTALIAGCYWLFGVGDKAPLAFTLLSAVALLALIYKLLERKGLAHGTILTTLALVVFVMPLPYLVLDGMEPVLHSLLTLWFLFIAAELLSADWNRSAAIGLAILAPLLVAARFEGLFLLVLSAGLFVLRGRFLYAGLLLGLGAIPIAIIGIPSVLHGGWLLPNSVMLKGSRPAGNLAQWAFHLPIDAAINLGQEKALCLITVVAVAALYFSADRRNPWRSTSLRLAMFLGIDVAHLALAKIGNPFRYEAYLVVTGICVLAPCWKEAWREKLTIRYRALSGWRGRMATAAMVVASLALLSRGLRSIVIAERASHNCFAQQYQMARFVQRFYQGKTLVLNDIGFVNYLTDIRLIDLVGIGSTEIARRPTRLDSEALGSIARRDGATLAIVYPKWLPGIPAGWIKVGEWELHEVPFALGGSKVVFFALDPAAAPQLRSALEQFDRELPPRVTAHLEVQPPPTLKVSRQ